MAYHRDTEWRVRSTGASDNGGGWQLGAAGVNYANQASPQVTYTDLVIDGAAATKATSAAFPFVAGTHEGNIVNITSGTGFTVQRAQIVSIAGAVATFDRNLGTLGSTGGSGKLGGALSHPAQVTGLYVEGNVIRIKKATYTTAATITFGVGNSDLLPCAIIGYDVTDDDNEQPTLQSTNAAANPVVLVSGKYSVFKNFIVDADSLSNSAFQLFGLGSYADNIEVRNAVQAGLFAFNFNARAHNCKATSCGGTDPDFYGMAGGADAILTDCAATGCANGFACFNGRATYSRCIASGNNKSGFYQYGDGGMNLFHCISDGNTLDGFRTPTGFGFMELTVENSVFSNNGGYGWRSTSVDYNNGPMQRALAVKWRNNAFYNNTAGERFQVADGLDSLTLSADPYVDQGAQDYTLNDTAGGGDALQGTVTDPIGTLMAPLTGTVTLDIGAFQSAAACPPPTAPSALAATVVSGNQINLTWTDNSTDEVYFLVERAVNGGSFAIISVEGPGTTSYSDTTVTPNNSYAYRVRAIN